MAQFESERWLNLSGIISIKMIKINFAIRQIGKDEADPFILFLSESQNQYGLWICKIINEASVEIFLASNENLNSLAKEVGIFIKRIGIVVDIHFIETPDEFDDFIVSGSLIHFVVVVSLSSSSPA